MKERTCLLIEYTSDSPSLSTPIALPLTSRCFSYSPSFRTRFSSLLSSLSAARCTPFPTPAPASVYAYSPSYFNYCSYNTLVHLLLTPPFPSPPNRLRVYPSSSSTISKLFFLPWPLRQPPNHPVAPLPLLCLLRAPLRDPAHPLLPIRPSQDSATFPTPFGSFAFLFVCFLSFPANKRPNPRPHSGSHPHPLTSALARFANRTARAFFAPYQVA